MTPKGSILRALASNKDPKGRILRVLGLKRALKVILMAPFGLPWSLVGLFLSQQPHKPTETHITSRSQQNQQHHYKKSTPAAQAARASPVETSNNGMIKASMS